MQQETTLHVAAVNWHGTDISVQIELEGFVAANYFGTNLNLTGFANWFGSRNLCNMLGECADTLFSAGHINLLELGSGLGRAGIMAAKMLEKCEVSSSIVLTDGEVEMVSLLSRNCALNSCANVDCRELYWGDNEALQQLQETYSTGFDVILGADLLYGGKQCDATCDHLLFTVNQLLSRTSQNEQKSSFYLAFTRREHMTIEKIDDIAKKNGLIMSVCEDYTLDIFENNVETDSMFWRDTILMFVHDSTQNRVSVV